MNLFKIFCICTALAFLSGCNNGCQTNCGASTDSNPAPGSGSGSGNNAPVLEDISAQSIPKNTTKAITLSGTDADGDTLSYAASSSDSTNFTTSISGVTLTLTPANNFTGSVTITAKANDGTVESAAKTFEVTVANTAPTLSNISQQTTGQSVKKNVPISAADANSDTLSYSISSSPSGKVSGSVSGTTLTLTPIASYVGTAAITLSVSDGTASTSKTFDLVIGSNDPLYQYQWHLDNTGQTNFASNAGTSAQDINVDGAITDGYAGNGVTVAIVDTGLEIAHEDLAGNVVSGGSWDYVGNDTDPTNSGSTGDHGTSVGGLTCAVGWNGLGGRGVSPSCSLKGFNWLLNQAQANTIAAHGGGSYAQDVDIFNQSYGGSYFGNGIMNTTVEAQYVDSTNNLRNGKGAIFVKSSGNAYDVVKYGSWYYCDTLYGFATGLTCQHANADPTNTLPYNIVVGALGATGVKSSYSSSGSNVWVSAPGGEYGYTHPAMMTADQSSCAQGYVRSGNSSSNAFNNQGNHSENSSCNYTSTFNGTSSAAPVLAGAIALILEANPNLTWRDVKHILATTSDQVDASKANITSNINGTNYISVPAWTTNDANHKFHDWYGFGRVNVGAAITAAKSYTAGSLGTLNITSFSSNASGAINATLPDNNAAGVTNTIAVSQSEIIEAVQITVNITHTYTGALAIELVSPAGTRSVLATPYNFFYTSDDITNMVLTSNAFYGEETDGNWTIRVSVAGSYGAGTLDDWSIRFFEH